MNKVAFIMDKPNCCGECEMSGTGVCRKWNMKDLKTFPKECPLKDIPEKKLETQYLNRKDCFGNTETYGEMTDRYAVGYNACIDEILKERD